MIITLFPVKLNLRNFKTCTFSRKARLFKRQVDEKLYKVINYTAGPLGKFKIHTIFRLLIKLMNYIE